LEWEGADKQISQRGLTKSGFTKKLSMTLVLMLGMLLAYSVAHKGFFTDITKRFSTSVQEDAQVTDIVVAPDSLYAGQPQEAPGVTYKLIDEIVSINEVDHRLPVDAPLRSDPDARSSAAYDAVIGQFDVEKNPRYVPRKDDTASYDTGIITRCHSFVWDVTRAMGAEIPYWVDENGEPNELELTEHGWWELREPAYWMSANAINSWLNQKGLERGWHQVPAEKAQEFANLGYPTVATVHEPEGFGHIGIVRPGKILNGPALAQAGTSNVNNGHVYDFFPREGTQFFVNDTGTTVERL
jgi:hypothetical protein